MQLSDGMFGGGSCGSYIHAFIHMELVDKELAKEQAKEGY
jgi:hypothetical protein